MLSPIKVRIAVAIAASGHWYAVGADNLSDKDARDEASACVDGNGDIRVYFVEATLDRPGEIVEGKVAEGQA